MMFKQVYIILFGIILLISFTHSASLNDDDENELDVSNQPISTTRLFKHEDFSFHRDEIGYTNQLPGEYENIFTSSQRRFQEEMLKAHNTYRARHCVSPLQLDDNLSHSAQNYAEQLASTNGMYQSDTKGVGQNMYTKSSSDYLDYVNGEEPTTVWYDEIKSYDFDQGGFSMQTGSFTQVVWKDTQRLGVGIAFTTNGRSAYIVAQYSPPGNYGNQYQENVLPAQC